MAEKFTILPSFAQQESNTAVLQDGGFADELLTSMRTKRVVDDAKHEKAQQELASSINFKTGDIFDVDLNVINKQKQDYLDWISANSEKIASHDLATLAKQKEWKGKIDMQVDKAIGRKQWYDKQTIYLTSPDGTKLGYGKQGDFDKLKKYKETALGEWEGYDKRNMFNEYDFFKDYNIEPQERVDDNGVTKITYSQTPAEDIVTVGQQKINSPQGKEYIEYYLDLANAANNGQTVDATIEYYDIEDFKKNGDKATVKTIQLKDLTPDNIESVIFFKKNALDKAYQNSTKKDVIAPKSPKSDDNKNNTITYQQGVNVPVRGIMMSGGKSQGVQTLEIPASGWDLSGTASKPSNINIKAPTTAIPLSSGEYEDLKDGNTINLDGGVPFNVKNPESWNVDVIGVYDIKVSPTGKPLFQSDAKGEIKRFALVKKGDRDFLIPYDNNIKNPLQTAGINLEELQQTTPTNNTSTTTNTSAKKYKGLDNKGNPIFE